MPRAREHMRHAKFIASFLKTLGLDVDKRTMCEGAKFPDIDLLIPFLKHRKTLHHPLVYIPFLFFDGKARAFTLGALIHIIGDFLPFRKVYKKR